MRPVPITPSVSPAIVHSLSRASRGCAFIVFFADRLSSIAWLRQLSERRQRAG
jgi:hypothetical protein